MKRKAVLLTTIGCLGFAVSALENGETIKGWVIHQAESKTDVGPVDLPLADRN